MSGNFSTNISDLYSVVDLNKKKRRPTDLSRSQHHVHMPVIAESDTTNAEINSKESLSASQSKVPSRNIPDLYAVVDLRKHNAIRNTDFNQKKDTSRIMLEDNYADPNTSKIQEPSSTIQEPMYDSPFVSQETKTSFPNLQQGKEKSAKLTPKLLLVLGIVMAFFKSTSLRKYSKKIRGYQYEFERSSSVL